LRTGNGVAAPAVFAHNAFAAINVAQAQTSARILANGERFMRVILKFDAPKVNTHGLDGYSKQDN
jgi:hypothetical protein